MNMRAIMWATLRDSGVSVIIIVTSSLVAPILPTGSWNVTEKSGSHSPPLGFTEYANRYRPSPS